MTAAMHGLGTRLGTFEQGLGAKVTAAERAAASATTAAQNAYQAAEHAAATARAGARSVASWAVLGALGGVLVAGEAPDTGSDTQAAGKAAWRTATGPPSTRTPPPPGPISPRPAAWLGRWTRQAASPWSSAAPARAGRRRPSRVTATASSAPSSRMAQPKAGRSREPYRRIPSAPESAGEPTDSPARSSRQAAFCSTLAGGRWVEYGGTPSVPTPFGRHGAQGRSRAAPLGAGTAATRSRPLAASMARTRPLTAPSTVARVRNERAVFHSQGGDYRGRYFSSRFLGALKRQRIRARELPLPVGFRQYLLSESDR
jgi:hypothetical protein